MEHHGLPYYQQQRLVTEIYCSKMFIFRAFAYFYTKIEILYENKHPGSQGS